MNDLQTKDFYKQKIIEAVERINNLDFLINIYYFIKPMLIK